MKAKLVLFSLLSAGALMADTKPLIVKSSGGGHMMPEYAGYERCEIYADKVVIVEQMGSGTPTSLKISEERKFAIQGDVQQVIEKAKTETVTEKPNTMCDGPVTGISANDRTGQSVLLFSTGACGTPGKNRDGIFSRKLKNIVNRYCPHTFEIPGRE